MIGNTSERWGKVSIGLHWMIAILILAVQAPIGLVMTELDPGPLQNLLFTTHKMVGILVFLAAILRLSWRAMQPTPDLPADLASWQIRIARTTHWLLYALLFAMPLTGYLYTALGGFPVPFFGLGDVGALLATNKPLADVFKTAHLALQYLLYAVVALHVAGALQHHFVRKDGVLVRMISSTRPLPATSAPGERERA